MERKKRNTSSSSEPSTSPKNVATGGQEQPTTSTSQEQSKTEQLDPAISFLIKEQCDRAITAVEDKNITGALNILMEVALRHGASGLVYRVQAYVYDRIFSATREPTDFKNAIGSAKQAALLSPNSIEYSRNYATLLSSASKDGQDYEAVVQECARGLSIQNPIDPAIDAPNYNSSKESPGERIAELKEDLHKIRKESESKLKKKVEEESGIPEMVDPLEIKEVTKTLERRRKEMEVQLAAARRKQQKSVSGQSSIRLQKDEEKAPRLSRFKKQRMEFDLKRVVHSAKKMSRVRPLWDSMSPEQKITLLDIKISDLGQFLEPFKNRVGEEILSEAVVFVKENKTWGFWDCCHCDKHFTDSESYVKHLWEQVIEKLSPQERSVLPQGLSTVWVQRLQDSPWKPVDRTEAFRIIESRSKEDLKVDDRQWPLVDDRERAEILEKIHGTVLLLWENECLAGCHLEKLMEYSMKHMEIFIAGWKLRACGLHQSLACICFLMAPQLKMALGFLHVLSQKSSSIRPSKSHAQSRMLRREAAVKIDLIGNSCLRLDKGLVTGGLLPYENDDAEAAGPSERDNFVCWLYAGVKPVEQASKLWKEECDTGKREGMEVFGLLESSAEFQSLCQWKCKLLRQQQEAKMYENICNEELQKRAKDAQYVPQSFESLCRKREEEYLRKGEDVKCKTSTNVTQALVEQAQDISNSRFEETLTGLGLLLNDLSRLQHNEPELKFRSEPLVHVHEEDAQLLTVLRRKVLQQAAELFEAETTMMQCIASLKEVLGDISVFTFHDYRSIVVDILRSFLQAYLEDLVLKEETARSEEACRQLLAEIDLEEKKDVTKGGNQLKQTQKKSKNMSKKKK